MITLFKDIKEFLDGAKRGAVYFSLGSNLQSHQLPARALKALTDAFAALGDQRVLWKHTGPEPIRARNVKFVRWAPQQAVLGTFECFSFSKLESFLPTRYNFLFSPPKREGVHYAGRAAVDAGGGAL